MVLDIIGVTHDYFGNVLNHQNRINTGRRWSRNSCVWSAEPRNHVQQSSVLTRLKQGLGVGTTICHGLQTSSPLSTKETLR